jgi:hypothetical protein
MSALRDIEQGVSCGIQATETGPSVIDKLAYIAQ